MRNIRALVVVALVVSGGEALLAGQPVRARHAMVVSREANATEVGVAILKAGGNAVDAAVAVGFALAVTHPSAGNLGGGGFLLVRFADGRASFVDFRERAPARSSRNMYLDAKGKPTSGSDVGYRAAGVPGTVWGLEFAHRKWGRRAWPELVTPAVALAEKGFPVSHDLAKSLRSKSTRKKLGRFPESRRIFLRDGRFYKPDEVLIQPELGRTLNRIRSQGSADFYQGETARLLAQDMASNGGLITREDLKNYAPVEREPLKGSYRGYEILTAPPPSSGGVGILQMLGVLEGTDFAKAGAGSAASLHMMAECMRRYFADRSKYMGDPAFYPVPVQRLLDREHIAGLRSSIDPEHASPSAQVKPGKLGIQESTDTTHYTIADEEGNVVAVTYTLNGGYGCGVTPPGLGFLLNNEMDDFATKPGDFSSAGISQGEANIIEPGKRPLSSMTPTIVLKEGRFFLTLGSPGGPTIIATVLQVLVNVLDFHMNVQDAADSPRIHHQWMPDRISMERKFPPATIAPLRARGHKIKKRGPIGEVAAIQKEGEWLAGAVDSRMEGAAKGY